MLLLIQLEEEVNIYHLPEVLWVNIAWPGRGAWKLLLCRKAALHVLKGKCFHSVPLKHRDLPKNSDPKGLLHLEVLQKSAVFQKFYLLLASRSIFV